MKCIYLNHKRSNLAMNNPGKTQAINVQGIAAVIVVPKGTTKLPFDAKTGLPIYIGLFFPGTPQNYGVPVVQQLENGRWGGVRWDNINPQLNSDNAYMFGYGRLTYKDIFGETTHVVTFCQFLEGEFITKVGQHDHALDLAKQCSAYNRTYDR